MSRIRLGFSVALALALALAMATETAHGAQDEGHKRAEEHIQKIERASEEMKEVRKRLDKAFEAYSKTLQEGADKRRSSYKDLVKELERCEQKTKELRKRHQEMDKKAEEFFKKWKDSLKDINNGDLRHRSEGRLDETRRRYREVSSSWNRMVEDYGPVLKEMRDQVVYLGHDLNDDAVASLKADAVALDGLKDEFLRTMDDFRSRADAYIEEIEPH